nr:reverse transcriptase domain-containing protein [Tanacetum cinerariifolium]
MQNCSSSRLVSNPSLNLTPFTNPNPKGRNHRRSKQRIEDFSLEDPSPPIVTMADQRTMAQYLQAPTEGYEDAIIVPAITADNFELKHGLLTLVQNKQFFGHDKEDPHAHVRYFNKITSTLKFPNVPNTSIKIMLFPFSLKGAARIWLELEPPQLIFTWDDLVSKFINQFFPPSKTTNLRNKITNFQQRFDESSNKMPRECLAIIESKSKVPYSRNKPVVSKVSTNSSTSDISPDVAELKDMVKALLLDKKSQNQSPNPVKAVEESCAPAYQALAPQTQGVLKEDFSTYVKANDAVMRNMQNQLTTLTDLIIKFMNPNSASNSTSEATKDTVNPTNNGSTKDVQPQVVQSESSILNSEPVISPIFEPVIALVSASKPNPKTSILYSSRRNDERNCKKANNQIEKLYQIFKDMSLEISFADALILMPKFTSTLKALIRNKEKLSEMARTPLNEHCSAVLLKKLPEKLGDPGKFLIPCDFPDMAECLALADLSASINLMPFSMWKRLSLPDLTPMFMTLDLADRLISRLVGVVEDVYVKVGSFYFPADFVVVDFDADPRVRLILGRSFLKIERALIDVFEEYSQEVLGFSDTISSGNPTSYYDSIVSTNSLTLTPFGNSDFLLEEVDAFLAIEDEPTSSEFYQPYLDPEGDILLLEAFLNDDPSLPPLNQRNYLPEVRKELKICEAKSDKSLVDEPQRLNSKIHLPTSNMHSWKSHKRAIAWKLSDIKGIDPEFYTYKILMEEDFELAVQHQRRVNPKIHDVIKQEVIKLLEAGLIYPISDSLWVSPMHCVPKREGFTVVENKDNELIPNRLENTTFTCPYGTFAYRRMPFGLCNAPSTFQRYMMAIFHDMIEKTIEVFMDDFFVFGNSFQSCLSHLERMLKRCEDTNLCLNWEKSHFMVKERIVLGHKISKQEIKVDKEKVDVITKLPHPTTVNECVEAFKTLKTKLTKAPILIAPDWDTPFELMCHASDFAIGVVIGQHQDKHFRLIHYASKTMIEAESNYTTTEKEMLAVVAIISDRGTHLCNDQFKKVMQKYGVTHRLATPYHPQTSGQMEVFNRGLKRILERAVGENRASWSDKLDDALWAFSTAYKTPIRCTLYKLVYGKACHLPVELEHKAYWALKHANFDLMIASDHRKVQINELNELRDQAYENSLIYKEKTKRLHDSKIKNRVFNIGDRVLLFNSCLNIFSGKLKSHWSGLFTISQVYPYGTVELSQPDGPNFKVNGHRLKYYFGDDIDNFKAGLKNEIHSSMRNQINNVLRSDISNQTNELRNMMASYFQKDTASTSGLGSLPSNTVANPRGGLKAITTRSGVSYNGPLIPPPTSSLPNVVERGPEVTKVTPKPTIPYPSRVNKQKLCEKDDNLALKFIEIFRNLHFELSFADALLYMPKFSLMFKSLLNNKEKLFDLATTLVNENCLAVILKKLLEKLRDPKKRHSSSRRVNNKDPSSSPPPPKELNVEEIKTVKSSIDEPPQLELKELPSHLEYAFLEGTDKLPIIISKKLKDKEKSTLLKIDFSDTFKSRLTHKTKKRLPSLALMERLPTDEKCHFMVKEGIVLGHKISKSRFKVNRDHSALKYLLAKQDAK